MNQIKSALFELIKIDLLSFKKKKEKKIAVNLSVNAEEILIFHTGKNFLCIRATTKKKKRDCKRNLKSKGKKKGNRYTPFRPI